MVYHDTLKLPVRHVTATFIGWRTRDCWSSSKDLIGWRTRDRGSGIEAHWPCMTWPGEWLLTDQSMITTIVMKFAPRLNHADVLIIINTFFKSTSNNSSPNSNLIISITNKRLMINMYYKSNKMISSNRV